MDAELRRCAAVAALALLPAVLPAAPPPLDMPPMGADLPQSTFIELDRDADGVIDRDEVPAGHALASEFDRHDQDDDRRIDRDEFDRYLAGVDDDELSDEQDDDPLDSDGEDDHRR